MLWLFVQKSILLQIHIINVSRETVNTGEKI